MRHYDRDGKFSRNMNRSLRTEQNDLVSFFRCLFQSPALPVVIYLHLRRRARRKRELEEFARSTRTTGLFTAKEIAVKWAEEHPDEYPFGKYAPNLPKLQQEIEKILH